MVYDSYQIKIKVGIAMKNKILKKKPLRILFILFLGVFLIYIICATVYSNTVLTVNRYELTSEKLNTDLRIVLIADLHCKEFGENNRDLVKKIAEQNPDIIAVDGDMVTKGNTDYSVCMTLMPQLCPIAPTYYALGNHELELLDNTNFLEDLEKTGVHLLSNKMEFFEKDGEQILIGGIKNYPYFDFDAPDFDNPENAFLTEFLEAEKQHYGILLCHYPEYYLWKFNQLDLDLMLCGHTHGGLIRLPLIGGVIAPEQLFFPKYDMGLFQSETANMIITSGLGISHMVPRFNNPPEICVIDIHP